MKIVSRKYFDPIEITDDDPYTLVIENGREYRNVVHNLYWQSRFDGDVFEVSDNNKILDLAKTCSVLTDLFSLDVNERTVLTKLQKEISEEFAGSQLYYDAVSALNALGLAICSNSEFPLSFDMALKISDIVKMLGVCIKYDDPATLIEKAVDYFVIAKKLLGKKLFIAVGLKDMMDEEEYHQFIKLVQYNKIPLLMLERHTHPGMDDVKLMTVIDEDLCVI